MFAAIFVFTTIFIISSWLTTRKPVFAIAFVVFLTPWVAFSVRLNLDMLFCHIATLPLMIRYVIDFKLYRKVSESFVSILQLLFIIISVFATLIKLPFLSEKALEVGFAGSPVQRSLFQILMLLITLLPVWLLPRYIKDFTDVIFIIKTLILSLTSLAFFGFIQLFVWFVTGVDPFPVGFIYQYLGGDPETVRYGGEYMSSSISLYRINSFGGEPKFLGSSMAMGMLLVQALLVYVEDKKIIFYLILCWVFLAISLLATLSTTAFVLWPLCSVMFYSFIGLKHSFQIVKKLVVLLFFILFTLNYFLDVPVFEIFSARTISRFETSETGYMEDFNEAIIDFLKANPEHLFFGTGLGNVNLYANSYLNPIVAIYADGTLFVAKSAWLRILSETGIFCLIIFIAWIYTLSDSTSKRCSNAGHVNLGNIIKALLLTYGCAYLLVGSYVVGIYMLVLGLGVAMSIIMKEHYIPSASLRN